MVFYFIISYFDYKSMNKQFVLNHKNPEINFVPKDFFICNRKY